MKPTQTRRITSEHTADAVSIWRDGGLVAFPTETVYGLGADATNDHAVARIYEAKGRPSFNPLIVHFAELDDVKAQVIWSDQAEVLATAFWPGPLTMVLPLADGSKMSKLVSAGLPSLAVRMPAHPVARALLRDFGGGIAAPSANRSGQISPTRSDHVLATLDGRIEAIVDGGACDEGLESTIIGLTDTPTILRPGTITHTQIEAILGQPVAIREEAGAISAPGQLASHYAPNASMRLNATDWHDGETRLGFGDVECDLNLSASGDLTEAAANLFAHLHDLDAKGASVIAVSPIPDEGLGRAINDRLGRAAAPRPDDQV
jgi:L-threonylcarbamoyladenylate synthase